MKTPQHFKREEIKIITSRVLGGTKTRLNPISICVEESLSDDFTTTNFSFSDASQPNGGVSTLSSKGKGFIDGLFVGLHVNFISDFPSLHNMKLVDMSVNPNLSMSRRRMATDAQAAVAFVVEFANYGPSEFQHISRSMIHSGFCAALEAFQFYINCERSFHRIRLGLQDAISRNRSDIAEKCKYDLSKLTEVNNYDRKKKN